MTWALIGGLICYVAQRLRLGSLHSPEPGLFPFLIGCAMLLLALLHMVIQFCGTARLSAPPGTSAFSHGAWRVLVVVALLLLYVIALNRLGYALCTFLLVLALLKIEQKTWKYGIVTSVLVSALSYIVFTILLKLNLPKGLLGV
jgi:glucose-6-phosphate-specific signal transduction histidine kinase